MAPPHKSDPPTMESGRAPTIDAMGSRRWIYPDRRSGRRQTIRRRIAVGLIAFYLIAPFLTVMGRPFLRFDFREDIAYISGLVFWLNDISYAALVLIGLAIFLFLATSLWGRIWCGYACPQTVFIDWLVRPIEEWIEGNAHKRRRQDHGPLTKELLVRKTFKHMLFLLLAAIIANAFLAYFVPPQELIKWITAPPWEHPWAFTFMFLILATFYFDLAWFREQFCSFLCPYARFQSVMIDQDTPAVSYDVTRGDPRGRRAKGDCIDCELCVRVCPTGIDIRNGLQLECIQCMRCADACDGIMSSLKRPLGLIRPASINELESKVKLRAWQRPRVWIYSLILLTIATGFVVQVNYRETVDLRFFRQPGVAYSILPDGRTANMFNLRITNHTSEDVTLNLHISDEPGAEIICGSCSRTLGPYERRKAAAVIILPKQSDVRTVNVSFGESGNSIQIPILGGKK